MWQIAGQVVTTCHVLYCPKRYLK